MKTLNCLLICLITLAFNPASGQQPPASLATNQVKDAKAAPPETPPLTRFNLDFPGGTPGELLTAIQKEIGKPLNAIVYNEYAGAVIPPLKLKNVDVVQLFQALRNSGNAFCSAGDRNGIQCENSIWVYGGSRPQTKACRFYSLAPYLDRGLKVDDITTAVETGWKMMGVTNTPAISFHKETKLLIAVGEPGKLETIDAVLMALEPPPQTEEQAKIKARLQQAILDHASVGK
ncbi:MAG TPA: hypothetical protein VMB80_12360 [Candidatus Acidoferrum sp.]|nr:hypothetical protein [Candidatus Acidoferrum sp.]